MTKRKSHEPKKAHNEEFEGLIDDMREQFPGVSEILEVYGDYEERTVEFKEYLEATQPLPFITTSNRSNP